MGLQEIANMNQEEILKRIQTIIVEVVGLGTPPKLKDRLFAESRVRLRSRRSSRFGPVTRKRNA
jgi:hypothetical protein